nr:YhcH/YjgK/YiaL family protein [Pseudopedobacter sp.]
MKKILLLVILSDILLPSCTAPNLSLKWFKSQDISKGLKPHPSSTINKAEFEKQYSANKTVWDKAFEWMKSQDLENLSVGKYPIDGDNAYASITETVNKNFVDAKWELHQKYIDLQYIIKGKEKIGMAPSEGAKVINSYNETKDVANYKIDNAKFITATPKEFYLFFTADAHRPNIKLNEEIIKKLVIKIHVTE